MVRTRNVQRLAFTILAALSCAAPLASVDAAPLIDNQGPTAIMPAYHDAPNRTYYAKEDTRFYTVSPLNTLADVWEVRVDDPENDVVFWEFDWADRPGVQTPRGMVIDTPDPPTRAAHSYLRISWVPGYHDAGVYHFWFDVNDGRINERTHFTIVVENTNRRPTIDAIPDQTVLEGQELLVHFTGREYDFQDPLLPDDIHFTASGIPAGAQFQDGHEEGYYQFTSTFIWTPDHDKAGTYTVALHANDYDPRGPGTGGIERPDTPLDPISDDEYVHPPVTPVEPFEYNATTSFQVTVVDVNLAPTCIRPEDVTQRFGKPFVIPVQCSDYDMDPVAMTATGLPAGATFSHDGNGLGTIEWTPTLSQVGFHVIRVSASDGEYTTKTEVVLTVHAEDGPPMFVHKFPSLAVETEPFQRLVEAHDPDDDLIRLEAEGLPAGASFTDMGDGNGRINWFPPVGSAGVHTVRIYAVTENATAHYDQIIIVRPAFQFEMVPIGGPFPARAPGVNTTLPVLLKNTGAKADSYSFDSYMASIAATPWSVGAPQPVTLGPGESTIVEVPLWIPEDGVWAKPRLLAQSSGNAASKGRLTWQVDVPVLLGIKLDIRDLAAIEGQVIDGVRGEVLARWIDGRPATGIDIVVLQQPGAAAENPQLSERLTTRQNGVTDEDGFVRFDFGLDPIARVPGRHDLTVMAVRGDFVDKGSETYNVGVS